MLRQRRSLLFALCASPLAVAGCASVGGPVEVADGAFMVPGSGGEPDARNLGRIGNAGFVVGDDGVVAIDTGVSYRHGIELLQAIGKVTRQPVRRVYITHVRQEFLFGAAAFRERGIPIHMHRRAAGLMKARCEGCLKTLRQLLGDDAMRGTAVVEPDATFDGGLVDTAAGRPLHVLHYGLSSGPGDIAMFDERSGTLFAGGLLDGRRVPDVQDGDLAGWQRALDALSALSVRRVVPGHGPTAGAELIEVNARYLRQLQARLLELLHAGAPLSDVADAASLPEFEDWDQYDVIHRRNASVVFLRLERELLLK
jgi:glyoxylase-like metal-dependent hydrolase (beta-lactamase superfamily II)